MPTITKPIILDDTGQGIIAAIKEIAAKVLTGPQGQQGIQGVAGKDGKDGVDGKTPVITASRSGGVVTIYCDGVSIATLYDGSKGDIGATGESGIQIEGSLSIVHTTGSSETSVMSQKGVTDAIDNCFVGTPNTKEYAEYPN